MDAISFLKVESEKQFTFDNQFLRASVLVVMPIQANASTNVDEKDGMKKVSSWYQLMAQYKSAYSANDETGEIIEDNATIKQIKIKFPPQTTLGVNPKMFKHFMDEHFVGKKALSLPVSGESPVFENKVPVKNMTQVTVDTSFSLLDFINETTKKSLPKS